MPSKLSPGTWHLLVPKEAEDNLRFRQLVLEESRINPEFRRGLRELCARDIILFIDLFGWQYNPLNFGNEIGPFVTWSFQEDALVGREVRENGQMVRHWGILECVEDQKDARWQKSRYIGASWLMLFVSVWLCLFHKEKSILVVSQDQDKVDKPDDNNCLFWKVDYILKNIPEWLVGGPLKEVVRRRKLGFKFTTTDSVITGEANTKALGVSGRVTLIFADEFAHFQAGDAIFGFTSSTANCRIFVFTHTDSTTMAYKICFDDQYRTSMREIVTHWSFQPEMRRGLYRYDKETNQVTYLDPDYKYPPDFVPVMDGKPAGGPYPGLRSVWYDEQWSRSDEKFIKVNFDIDPHGNTTHFFDHYKISYLRLKYAREPRWTGILEYNPQTGRPVKLVADPAGRIRMWHPPMANGKMPARFYAAGVDVATGGGRSPSCLCVYDAETGEKIIEYSYNQIYANDFASFVCAMGRLCLNKHEDPMFISWEAQGKLVFDRRMMFDLNYGYANVTCQRDEDARDRALNPKYKTGVPTSPREKEAMLEAYRTAIFTEEMTNPSSYALDECLRFVYSAKKHVFYEVPSTDGEDEGVHHGDVTIADALACRSIKEIGLKRRKVEKEAEWVHPNSVEELVKETIRQLRGSDLETADILNGW